MDTMIVSHDIYVMAEDPAPGIVPKEALAKLKTCKTEADIAALYGMVYNKLFWDGDEIDDNPRKSSEWKAAVKNYKKWVSAEKTIRKKVIRMAKKQGAYIKGAPLCIALRDYMNQYGIQSRDGWWITPDNDE